MAAAARSECHSVRKRIRIAACRVTSLIRCYGSFAIPVNPEAALCAETGHPLESHFVSAFTIRDAVPGDFDAILDLWGRIDRHTGLPDRREYLQTFHDFAPDLFLVAETDGRIIGTVIGGWDGWRAQIARLATDTGWRRKGVAQAMVTEIEGRLHARGANRIYALVDRRSPPAIPFWESYGYAANDNIVQYSRNLGEEPG